MFLLLTDVTANGTEDMLVNADTGEVPERYLGTAAQITYALEATAVGCTYQIVVGGRRYVDTSTLDAGGTVGVAPNLDSKATSFFCEPGTIQVLVSETAGTATTDLMLTIEIDPI